MVARQRGTYRILMPEQRDAETWHELISTPAAVANLPDVSERVGNGERRVRGSQRGKET
ncbi:hypothetical protein [Saccharothrix sp. ALI-22-I]|uniref:hypothetical protein n=1 Tax=Saccharothrix sp. ALI-22-I TaxID=1933778 RepID=UPI0015C3B51B|nr:hypothetical protein [Saccharothrix sp. ALI-22-I]